MTSAEPTEIEELSRHVLGIIGAYGVGVSLNPKALYMKTAPAAPTLETPAVPDRVTSGKVAHHVAR